MKFDYYGSLAAEVYDLDKPIGHSFGDIEFYKERLKGCKGKILEPGVGTGRMLIPLLQDGYDVVGFDRSKSMLAICEKNCSDRDLRPKLFVDQMESFSLEERFGAIIISTGTFLLSHVRENSLKALENFYHHLAPGGKLIVDLVFEHDFAVGTSELRVWENREGDVITLEKIHKEVDYIRQFTTSYLKYEKWSHKNCVKRELEKYCIRWYGVEEFRLILEKIGFKDLQISSDYQFGVYPDNSSQVITFEAKRK